MKKYSEYMEHAINLAKRGFGMVEPNPMVGCVIVNDHGEIIGEGWHRQYGQAHAEINAINDCKSRGNKTKGSTVCVTLEPCSHYGKTPPCAEAIIAAKPRKVVVAMVDPSEKVSGKGIKMLEDAGIVVSVGTCQKNARLLNPAFIKYHKTALPWVVLKWAQTIDGFMASSSSVPEESWITSEASRKDVQMLRRSCDGILVGIGTALADNPLLTARPSKDRSPHRFVLDSNLRIDTRLEMFNTISKAPLTIITTSTDQDKIANIEKAGAEILQVSKDDTGRCNLQEVMIALGKMKIQRLMVEGGPTIIAEMLKEKIADEIWTYIAPKIFTKAGKDSLVEAFAELEKIDLHHSTASIFDCDTRITALTKNIAEI